MNKKLPDFQKFLISKKLVPLKNIPYYAHWISEYLSFSNKHDDLTLNLRIKKFLRFLNDNKNIEDWQIQQADTALKLYINNFLHGKTSDLNPNKSLKTYSDYSTVKPKIQDALRIKHYSYKTERSYLNWIKRFHEYITNTKKKDLKTKRLDSTDVKDYLSYLATKKRVSATNHTKNGLLKHLPSSNLSTMPMRVLHQKIMKKLSIFWKKSERTVVCGTRGLRWI